MGIITEKALLGLLLDLVILFHFLGRFICEGDLFGLIHALLGLPIIGQ
ncbi:MAG: hypothetical protein ACNA7G_10420 [Methylobacter sp.]